MKEYELLYTCKLPSVAGESYIVASVAKIMMEPSSYFQVGITQCSATVN